MSVVFDGSTYLSGVDGTYFSDTKQFHMHFWFRPTDVSGFRTICANSSGRIIVYCFAGILYVALSSTTGAAVVTLTSTTTFSAASPWTAVDVVVSTDTTGAMGRYAALYVNGVLEDSDTPTADALIDWSDPAYHIGYNGVGVFIYAGELDQLILGNSILSYPTAPLYVTTDGDLTPKYVAEMYDLTSTGALRRKRASVAHGAGTPPLIALERAAAEWGTNNGTAGDFVVSGSLTAGTTPPMVSWNLG